MYSLCVDICFHFSWGGLALLYHIGYYVSKALKRHLQTGDLAQLDRARVCLRLNSRHSSMALRGPVLTGAKPEALSPFFQNSL